MMDKRTTPRVPIYMNIEAEDHFEPVGFGYARDISESGLAIDAEAMMEPVKMPTAGSELRMRFKLPQSLLVITAIGRVVRVESKIRPPLLALEFIDLVPEFRSEIRRYVRRAHLVPV